MNPEKYSPTPEDIQNAEEMLSPEQRLVSDLREKILSGNLELPEQATEQQQVEVLNEVGDIAKIFNDYGRPWFFAGGTSLELAGNEITRNHQDSDIAMYRED